MNNSFHSTTKHIYKGHLKYTGICGIGLSGEFVMSGGWNTMTNEASSEVYMFKFQESREMKMWSPLENARYGHCSVFCNGTVFVIGGFAMDDNIDTEPSTLSSCERYFHKENIWVQAAPLNVPRAYAGVVWFPTKNKSNKLKNEKNHKKRVESLIPAKEYIYLFAGLNDFIVLDSIEKYDAMLDTWSLINLKVPVKIAKIGVSILDQYSIIICGGIYSNEDDEFNYVNTVYKLDLINEKWSKLPTMYEPRVLYPWMPRTLDKIFAIGGSFKGICEYFDVKTLQWNPIQGYDSILAENDIQTFGVINMFR